MLKLDRVAIVDTDYHPGDGTQSIFYQDPTVLTISIHVGARCNSPGKENEPVNQERKNAWPPRRDKGFAYLGTGPGTRLSLCTQPSAGALTSARVHNLCTQPRPQTVHSARRIRTQPRTHHRVSTKLSAHHRVSTNCALSTAHPHSAAHSPPRVHKTVSSPPRTSTTCWWKRWLRLVWQMLTKFEGTGYNVNIPWPHEFVDDADYEEALQTVVVPALRAFQPQLILWACGFDAMKGDGQFPLFFSFHFRSHTHTHIHTHSAQRLCPF